MKKLSKIFGLLILVSLLMSCGGGGGGSSGLGNLFNNNNNNNTSKYSFSGKSFDNCGAGGTHEQFVFTDGTNVKYYLTDMTTPHVGTYTAGAAGVKDGTLAITFTDGTAPISRAYSFQENGSCHIGGVTFNKF